MLIFDKWFKEKHGRELDYEKEEEAFVNNEFSLYNQYKKEFPLTFGFLDAWSFLEEHPIFRGQFQSGCLDIRPTMDDNAGECILLETSVYVNKEDLAEEQAENLPEDVEFATAYNSNIDVWSKTFENAIQQLAELVKTEYGEYTDDESILAVFELSFGKDKGREEFEELKKSTQRIVESIQAATTA